MKLTFAPRGILQIDDARIIWPNFEGREGRYNRAGEREFTLVITGGEVCERGSDSYRVVDAQEMAEILMNDVNKYGVGWNVKIKPPREDGDVFIHMKVKVKFNDRGPTIRLETGNNVNYLDAESVKCLDYIDIVCSDMDIRPYDDLVNEDKPFRAAYLQSLRVVQEVDRFRTEE